MCDMAMLILNRCAEGKPHDTKAYPGKMYIPGFFKVRTAPHTPLRKFDSPRDMDTSTSDMTAIDTVTFSFLYCFMTSLDKNSLSTRRVQVK